MSAGKVGRVSAESTLHPTEETKAQHEIILLTQLTLLFFLEQFGVFVA